MKIFVYGSLKQQEDNHDKMQRANGEFLFPAVTVKRYYVQDNWFYKSLVDNYLENHAEFIEGEVYEVPDDNVEYLDAFEDPLERKEIQVEFENIKIPVQCYFEKDKNVNTHK